MVSMNCVRIYYKCLPRLPLDRALYSFNLKPTLIPVRHHQASNPRNRLHTPPSK